MRGTTDPEHAAKLKIRHHRQHPASTKAAQQAKFSLVETESYDNGALVYRPVR